MDDRLSLVLKLHVLLYADDTVLLAETPNDLQRCISLMEDYCHNWGLKINTSKTKVTIFSRGKVRNLTNFILNGTKLYIVYSYKYLGVHFNHNGKFTVDKNDLCCKGFRAMFSLLRKCKQLQLPIDIQLQLFDVLVKPVVLYGCEVWAHEGTEVVEKLHLRFCKYILSLNKSTCTNMVYGELGITPLLLHAQSRMIMFWSKIIEPTGQNKLSNALYQLLFKLHNDGIYESQWIKTVSIYLKVVVSLVSRETRQLLAALKISKNRFSSNWLTSSFKNDPLKYTKVIHALIIEYLKRH